MLLGGGLVGDGSGIGGKEREGGLEGVGVLGEGNEGVGALRDAEVVGVQPGVLNDTTGEQLDVALLSAVVVLLVNEGGVISAVPDPSVLGSMLGAVISNTGIVVWVLDDALIYGELVVSGPELSDV